MADEPRIVRCVKLKQDLPGLDRPPFKNELGERLYREVSKEAWGQWLKQATLIINEYQLSLALPEAQAFLMKQCEAFFYGEGAHVPKEFTPGAPGSAAGSSGAPQG